MKNNKAFKFQKKVQQKLKKIKINNNKIHKLRKIHIIHKLLKKKHKL